MQKLYLFFIFLLLSCINSTIAQTVIINTGTPGTPAYNAGPFYRSSASSAYDASRYTYLYTQSELSAVGIITGSNITQLGWTKNNSAVSNGGAIVRIYLKNSNTASFANSTETWNNLNSGAILVYENTNFVVPATSSPEYITFPLNAPFNYSGGSLEVSVEFDINQVSGNASTGTFDWLWSIVPDRIYGTGNTVLGSTNTLSSTTNSISDITNRRPFLQVTYIPSSPCTNPPNAGVATSSHTGPVCPGSSVSLNVNGASIGTGLTFTWESSATNNFATPTTISSAQLSSAFSINPTSTTYYRAKVICNNGTPAYSTPIMVPVAGGLAGGTYTINAGAPTSGTNFNSFTAFTNALDCGILGNVVVNVVPNSGPYNEVVSFGTILGTNATNRITINGNGNTVQFTNTANQRQLLTLDGTNYLKIDSLTFKSLATAYGWGAIITGNSQYDSITRCTFDLTSITSTTSANSSGICFTASATSVSTAGSNGSHCYIGNSKILGGTSSGSYYYGITMYGDNNNNVIENVELANVYYYGIYISAGSNNTLKGNIIHRATKPTTTTFYGIYTTGTTPGMRILNNKIHSPGGTTNTGSSSTYLYYISGDGTATNRSLIANNIAYNINQGGTVYGIYALTPLYTDILHNTIDYSTILSSSTSTMYGIYVSGTNNYCNLFNNLVNITGGNGGSKYPFYIASAVSSVDNAQGNNYYINTAQAGTAYYGYYGTAYNTLAAFQTAYPGVDIGMSAANPEFTNIATGNLMPTNVLLYASGSNQQGLVSEDINGTPRTTSPTPGAYEMPLPPLNNAGVQNFVAPAEGLCPGTYPVSVTVNNLGANILNNVQIHWSINGVLQSPITYNTPINTAISGTSSAIVTLGNVSLTNSNIALKAWTYLPNGVTDTDLTNDTAVVIKSAALNGAYTIDASLPNSTTNFSSFTSFTDALTIKGICGPVIANVNPNAGIYNEHLFFGDISGSSPINTITVNGNGAQIQYSNTTTDRQLLTFNGSKYIKVDSINFKALNSAFGWAALITNGSYKDSITRCTFDLTNVTATSSANSSGICFSSSNTSATSAGTNGTQCYIGGNKLLGNTGAGGYYYAITVCGASDSNTIENNLVQNFYYYGIYVSGAKNTQIKKNNVNRATKNITTTFYGIYTTGTVPNTVIANNSIHSPCATPGATGTSYFLYLSGDGAVNERCEVYNNAIYNVNQPGSVYGIYGLTLLETDVYHNTFDFSNDLNATSTMYGIYITGSNNNAEVKNNIVSITGGTTGTKYGFYYSTATSVNDPQGNQIHMNSSQTGTQNYGYLTTAYATQVAFQTAYPTYELGSLTSNPSFVSANNGILTPTNIDYLNSGVNLLGSVPTDINNYPRNATTPTSGAFEIGPGSFNNAGVLDITAPNNNFCSGLHNVTVDIKNHGYNTINSINVHWSINGVIQTPVVITTNIAANTTTAVTLGQANFPLNTAVLIKAWTSLPNGVIDNAPIDDSSSLSLQATYSVMVDLGNDTAVCEGTSLFFDAGNTGASYLWSNGSTTQTININSNGSHSVRVTLNDGCVGRDTITVNHHPSPTQMLGADISICRGSTLNLDAGNPGSSYVWDNGATSQVRTVDDIGVYSVTITNIQGCVNADTIVVSYIDLPIAGGINAVYSDSATYYFNPINPQYASEYEWNFGDGSPLAYGYSVSHQFIHNGIYNVTLKMSGMCDSAYGSISKTVDVFDAHNGTSINNVTNKKLQFKLYPNPAQQYITLQNSNKAAIKSVQVYNVLGQELMNLEVNSSNDYSIETHRLANGTYTIKIITENGIQTYKFDVLQ
jgi:parallel beta-helix repeat protein